MKNFAFAAVALAGFVLGMFFHHLNPRVYAAQSSEPREISYSLLPSQSRTINLGDIRRLEIRSQFPVSIFLGTCYNTYTVQWSCDPGSQQLYITDRRAPAVFKTPPANEVTVTVTE